MISRIVWLGFAVIRFTNHTKLPERTRIRVFLQSGFARKINFPRDGRQTLGTRAPSPAIERAARTIVTGSFDSLAGGAPLLRTRASAPSALTGFIQMWKRLLGQSQPSLLLGGPCRASSRRLWR